MLLRSAPRHVAELCSGYRRGPISRRFRILGCESARGDPRVPSARAAVNMHVDVEETRTRRLVQLSKKVYTAEILSLTTIAHGPSLSNHGTQQSSLSYLTSPNVESVLNL